MNNAGVFTFQPLEAVTEEEFHRQFDTNVLGTLLATQEAAATFDGAGGSVINLSTISSVNPVPSSVVYSASKAAVDTITRALANELAPKKIRVNAIAPGATETEGTRTMGLTMEAAKAMGMACRWPAWSAGRYRAGGAVPRLGPVVVADRRAHLSLGRSAIATER